MYIPTLQLLSIQFPNPSCHRNHRWLPSPSRSCRKCHPNSSCHPATWGCDQDAWHFATAGWLQHPLERPVQILPTSRIWKSIRPIQILEAVRGQIKKSVITMLWDTWTNEIKCNGEVGGRFHHLPLDQKSFVPWANRQTCGRPLRMQRPK